MKILSFNMCYATGVTHPRFFFRYFIRSPVIMRDIATFISSIDPDVLAVTEIASGLHQDTLAKSASFATIFSYMKYASWCRWIPFLRTNHNAVFLKQKQRLCERHYFRSGFKKLVLQVQIRSDIDLFVVHLALRRKTRAAQLVELSRLLMSSSRQKIITGDFNTFVGVAELQNFMNDHHLRSLNVNNIPTFPTWKPRYEFDFFLVSSDIVVRRFEVLQDRLSDHLPIFLEIV